MRSPRRSEMTLGLLFAVAMLGGCSSERATPQNSTGLGVMNALRPHASLAAAVPCPTGSPPAATATPPASEIVHAFSYTGKEQLWKVPGFVTSVNVMVQGAQGSSGLGGCESGTLSVTPGESLYITAGGAGQSNGTGGFNGGGNGGKASAGGEPGGGGGGASDVRVGGDAIANRIIVAGGGGGTSGDGWSGGTGGGLGGGDGSESSAFPRGAGGGGTQTHGGKAATGGTDGSLGAGGTGGSKLTTGTFGGGGGGGGYYGGGGGRYSHHDDPSKLDDGDSGGGGGSGYIAAAFTNASAGQGVHYGSGVVTLSWQPVIKRLAYNLDNPQAIAEDAAGNVYLVNDQSYVTVYRPDGTVLYKIGSGFKHATAVVVSSHVPPTVYVLADSMTKPKPGDPVEREVYRVSPPFDAGGTMHDSRISYVGIAGIAADEKFLYVLSPCQSGGSCKSEIDLYQIRPDNGYAIPIVYRTVRLDAYVASISAASCVYAQGCLFYAIEKFPAQNSSTILRISAPDLAQTTVTNGAGYFNIATLGGSAVDGGNTLYATTSYTTIMKIPPNEQWTFVAKDFWNAPFALAVNPDCPFACSLYVLDSNNGGEIDLVTGFDR